VAVISNQRINHVFRLRLRCSGWSIAEGRVSTVLFLALETIDPASELTWMAFSPYMLLRRLWISIGMELCAVRNSFTTLPSTYIHKSAILQCYCVECT
jgi:hypothetical protein